MRLAATPSPAAAISLAPVDARLLSSNSSRDRQRSISRHHYHYLALSLYNLHACSARRAAHYGASAVAGAGRLAITHGDGVAPAAPFARSCRCLALLPAAYLRALTTPPAHVAPVRPQGSDATFRMVSVMATAKTNNAITTKRRSTSKRNKHRVHLVVAGNARRWLRDWRGYATANAVPSLPAHACSATASATSHRLAFTSTICKPRGSQTTVTNAAQASARRDRAPHASAL